MQTKVAMVEMPKLPEAVPQVTQVVPPLARAVPQASREASQAAEFAIVDKAGKATVQSTFPAVGQVSIETHSAAG